MSVPLNLSDEDTDLWWQTLLVVYDHAPPEVQVFILHLDQATGLQKRKRIVRMGNDFAEIRCHAIQLLTVIVIGSDDVFIGDGDSVSPFFLFLQL